MSRGKGVHILCVYRGRSSLTSGAECRAIRDLRILCFTTGPLEATVAHLKQEIIGVMDLNQSLQRKWIATQRELIDLRISNSALNEAIQKLETERAVIIQRHERLLQM